MEEAILNGVIVPHHTRRVSRRHANREKPKLWEARVSPAENDRWDTIVVRPVYLFIYLIFQQPPPLSPLSHPTLRRPPLSLSLYGLCTRWRWRRSRSLEFLLKFVIACVCTAHFVRPARKGGRRGCGPDYEPE